MTSPPIIRKEVLFVVVACVAGLVLRLWFAHRAPGLWYDEAIYGLDSLDVLRKPGWPIFFTTENHMREPMYMYWNALWLGLVGVSAFTLRAGSAIIGTVTLPFIWLLAREFAVHAGNDAKRIRWFAAGTLALATVFRWHVHFSGLGFRTILAPLFSAMSLWLLLRTLRTWSWRDAIACGIALGAGAYTYLAFRLFPFIIALPVVMALLKGGTGVPPVSLARTEEGLLYIPPDVPFGVRLSRLAAMFVAALITFAPLGLDYLRNPDHFRGRGEEVSYLNQPGAAQLFAKQVVDVALMGICRGDHVGKHNLPGPPQWWQPYFVNPERATELWSAEAQFARMSGSEAPDPHGTGIPVFPPVSGVLFYAGLAIIIWRSRRSPAALAMASLLVVGSLASILSFGAPNMLRMTMLIPGVLVTLACGFAGVAGFAESRFGPRPVMFGLVGAFIFFTAGQCVALYRWPTHPMVPLEFNVELADVGKFLAAQPDRLPLRTSIGDPPTLRFIADGYRINPPEAELGDRWWEFQTIAPFPPLESKGKPIPGGRHQQIMHPAGIVMGEVVEVGK